MTERHIQGFKDTFNDDTNIMVKGARRVIFGATGGLYFGIMYNAYNNSWARTGQYTGMRLANLFMTDWIKMGK